MAEPLGLHDESKRLQRSYGSATGDPSQERPSWLLSVTQLPGGGPILCKASEAATLVLLAGDKQQADGRGGGDEPGALAEGSVCLRHDFASGASASSSGKAPAANGSVTTGVRGGLSAVAHVGYLQATACIAVVVKVPLPPRGGQGGHPPAEELYRQLATPGWLQKLDRRAKATAWHVALAEGLASSSAPTRGGGVDGSAGAGDGLIESMRGVAQGAVERHCTLLASRKALQQRQQSRLYVDTVAAPPAPRVCPAAPHLAHRQPFNCKSRP